MKTILKQLKAFWIYNLFIIFFMILTYISQYNNNMAIAWGLFIYMPIIWINTIVAGPILAYTISKKYNISILNSIIMSIIIFVSNCIAICIPYINTIIKNGFFDNSTLITGFNSIPSFILASLFEISLLIINNCKNKKVS